MSIAWLTLLGVLIIPFTELRFTFIGLGEVLIVLALMKLVLLRGMSAPIIPQARHLTFILGAFFLVSLLSFAINYMAGGSEDVSLSMALFNLAAYGFNFLALLLLSNNSTYDTMHPVILFRRLYFYWGIIFLVLFVTSFFLESIGPYTLRWMGRFLPLVENQHQTALMFCTLPFIGLQLASNETTAKAKIITYIMAVLYAVMAVETGSDKAVIALALGGAGWVGAMVISRQSASGRRIDASLTAILLIALGGAIVVGLPWLNERSAHLFSEMDYQGARSAIWRGAITLFTERPIIGGGPGQGVRLGFDYMGAHNSLLEAAIQAGLIGLLLALSYLVWLGLQAFSNPAAIATVLSLVPYFLGGDVFRRTNYWVLVLAAVVIAETTRAVRARAIERECPRG